MTAVEERPEHAEPSDAGLAGPGARYTSDLHDTRIAAILGAALGIAFTTCFVTGLLSHLIQHPYSWFHWTSRPAGLYRVTQGVHIATGMASIPLLVAKLWVVAPRFWAKPAVRDAAHGIERAMLFPLVGGSAFLLVTGTLNTFQWYPWGFFFPTGHYWAAWLTIGGLIAHVGAKSALTWRALRHGDRRGGELTGRSRGGDRRWFIGGIAAAAGALTVATVGQTAWVFRRLSVLAPRDPEIGPQGFPVNRTMRAAGITAAKVGPAYRLRVHGRVGAPVALSLTELQALPQHHAVLPIACVEGWSASARWSGVRLRDLLDHAEAEPGTEVIVTSLQTRGRYGSCVVGAGLAADPDTLLALRLDGEPLAPDHGYPVRLIAPNRPGVLQTKWVDDLEVR